MIHTNKLLAIAIVGILLVAGVGYLILSSASSSGDDLINGEISIHIEEMDSGVEASSTLSITPPNMIETMILAFGGAIRQATFTSQIDNIDPDARYAVWAIVTYDVEGGGEIIESYATFKGVPGESFAGSRYYWLKTSTGLSESIEHDTVTSPGSQFTITQTDRFVDIYCNIPSMQGTMDLLGKYIDGTVLSVGFYTKYSLDGEIHETYTSATLEITTTSSGGQMVCKIVDIDTEAFDLLSIWNVPMMRGVVDA